MSSEKSSPLEQDQPFGHPSSASLAEQRECHTDESPPVKLWTTDEPLRSPIPPPAGDPLITVVEKQRKYDRERCEMWKDEIDKILLFAALFSAIVTAFTIESSKRLEVDPQEAASTILFAMHQQLDVIARQNTTTIPALMSDPTTTFHAPRYAIYVNVCWYLSLILSLTAVLVGILCLQWLREHLRDSDVSTTVTEQLFVRRALRIHALDSWMVPAFIASLPVFLLAALLLFLAGLEVLLWNVSRTVAIASSGAVGVAVAVLLVTSILPVISHRCAFRAPQVWFFYYLWRGVCACVRYLFAVITWAIIIFTQCCLTLCNGTLYLLGKRKWVDKIATKAHQVIFRITVIGFGLAPTPQYLRDWLSVDEKAAEEELHRSNARPVYWEWFTTTFYQDQEAMLAFVHYVQAQVGSITDHGDTVSLFRQMSSLLRGLNPWLFYRLSAIVAWFLESSQHDTPIDVQQDRNLGLALCLAYTVKMQPLLLPQLFKPLMECLIKVTNSYPLNDSTVGLLVDETIGSIGFEVPMDLPPDSNPAMDNHIRRIQDVVVALPLETFRQQAREALFQTLTLRETHPLDITRRISTMIFLEPDLNRHDRYAVPEAVSALNQQLERTLTSSSAPGSAVMAQNIAEAGEADRRARAKRWYGGAGASFRSLARAVAVELSKPENHELQTRSDGYLVEWNWLEFAQKEIFLTTVDSFQEREVCEATPDPPHRTVSILPPSQSQHIDAAISSAE